jgi:uncharacterized coiled-coil protein SlyX
MKKALIYGPVVLLFLAAGWGLISLNNQIAKQNDIIKTASEIISAHKETIDGQQVTIDNMLVLNEALVNDVATFQEKAAELEKIANSRSCQSIDLSQYENDIYNNTSYVITPAKMGWNGYWSIRENVVLVKDYGLARGYEFRIDLTPENYGDFWQEIHTTIRPFATAEEAQAYFNENVPDNVKSLETTVDFGIPVRAWASVDDSADTMKIEFVCGNYQLDIKTKYLPDVEVALPILEKAATILFGELSVWAP